MVSSLDEPYNFIFAQSQWVDWLGATLRHCYPTFTQKILWTDFRMQRINKLTFGDIAPCVLLFYSSIYFLIYNWHVYNFVIEVLTDNYHWEVYE